LGRRRVMAGAAAGAQLQRGTDLNSGVATTCRCSRDGKGTPKKIAFHAIFFEASPP